MGFIIIPTDLLQLKFAILHGTAFAVTDGSFKQGKGTSAFTLQTGFNSKDGILGSNEVVGPREVKCAYRSKLAGILGILVAIWAVCEIQNITEGSITVGCDNQQAGKKGIEEEEYPDIKSDHYDILRLIHDIRRRIPLQLQYRYIEALQMEKYPTRPLDHWARWNEIMDQTAKAKWEQTKDRAPHILEPSDLPWTVFTKEGPIVKRFNRSLKDHLSTERLEQWWIDNGKFTKEQLDLIDFRSCGQAMSKTTAARRRWVVRFAADQLPTGKQMRRQKEWNHDHCPRCSQPAENAIHIVTCMGEGSMEVKKLAVTRFICRLEEGGTSTPIKTTLCTLLNGLLFGEEINIVSSS